ncbi:LOG family protein [Haloterrigena sp. SYSU A558-1]|uniref:LOG family protein n=1 Tax=Haloterrigena gelatinilytica TaxID=2741724 RepID=A0ABX2LCX9_9EURY|nr:LOG family protein [Haloterrigena gelatinilytica]NUC74124.1 LOG family protein [Haloterrigena gelatinilytica]
MRVSVIGGGAITDEQAARAEAVGRELGARGHTVVCGGRGGTMEAVCRGAKAEGATTIGILPSDRTAQANDYVDVPIATGLGHARNALVPMNGDVRKSLRDFRANQKSEISGDAVIALTGGVGTLSEIGFAGIYDRPVVGLETHDVSEIDVDLETVETPEAAVDAVEAALADRF